jgi:hypothetical protein
VTIEVQTTGQKMGSNLGWSVVSMDKFLNLTKWRAMRAPWGAEESEVRL